MDNVEQYVIRAISNACTDYFRRKSPKVVMLDKAKEVAVNEGDRQIHDIYRDEYWLEICPQNCTKAKSILKLKEEYGFEKLVVFGDSVNDLPMFKIADESYAVSNAIEELKAQATKVIGSNEEDAVAKFLMGYLDSSITV